MIAAVASATTPRIVPARPVEMDLGIRVEEGLTGKPEAIDRAHAAATTRFELEAPAGTEIRVRTPEGVGMNGFAWANAGRTGLSFTRQGAEWVTTADEPLRQLSLQTHAFQDQGGAIRASGDRIEIDDLTPTVTVGGQAPARAAAPVTVVAPLGWQTTAADGSADALQVAQGVRDTVSGVRDASKGAATVATFTGRAPDGGSTTGASRAVREAGERVGDAAFGAIYTALQLGGVAP